MKISDIFLFIILVVSGVKDFPLMIMDAVGIEYDSATGQVIMVIFIVGGFAWLGVKNIRQYLARQEQRRLEETMRVNLLGEHWPSLVGMPGNDQSKNNEKK